MQGLNHVGLNLELASDTELAARIRLIDRRMNYHLVVDENGSGVSDAIAVAGLLGLDPAIIRRASDFFRDGS
jgi:hypothetical protein